MRNPTTMERTKAEQSATWPPALFSSQRTIAHRHCTPKQIAHKFYQAACTRTQVLPNTSHIANLRKAERNLTPSIVQTSKYIAHQSSLHTRSTEHIAPSEPKQTRVRPDPQRHLSAPHPDLIVCMFFLLSLTYNFV